jgi:hypothetical protein
MVRELMIKSRGLGKPDDADAEFVAILVALNPDTLVHALYKGNRSAGVLVKLLGTRKRTGLRLRYGLVSGVVRL